MTTRLQTIFCRRRCPVDTGGGDDAVVVLSRSNDMEAHELKIENGEE